MRRHSLRALLVCAAGFALGGCATLKAPLTAERTAALMSPAEAYDVWDRVLADNVDARGRVDFVALADHPAALDRFVDWV